MELNYKNTTAIDLEIPSEVSKFLTEKLTNYIVIKNGHIIKKKLSAEFDSVYLNDYNTAITEKPEVFKMYHSNCINKNEAIIENFDKLNSGILIHVPKNLVFKETLNVFYVSDQEEIFNGITIVVEENTEFKYFEYLINTAKAKINVFSNLS